MITHVLVVLPAAARHWENQAVSERQPTAVERRFFDALAAEVEGVQDWYHQDADGTHWMIASYDVVMSGSQISATYRCDFDGDRLSCGASPGYLNWDSGVRAAAACVDMRSPQGLDIDVINPEEAAAVAARWLKTRRNAASSG